MLPRNISSPEEIRRRKILRKGIKFTLLICGEEGSGKGSFINTLCNQQVISKLDSKGKSDSVDTHGLEIVQKHVDIIEENSTPINLDIVLVPGFGDEINNDECVGKVLDYLNQQFGEVLNEECRIRRDPKFQDGRPHACLYFIRPTSKGLRELDVQAMKTLAARVNVIPVISKSDTLTEDELALNKALVLQDIKANGINVYDFSLDIDEESEFLEEQLFLKNNLPFAIAGSYATKTFNDDDDGDGYVQSKIYHVREYPWGTFKVEDLNHSDFNYLRNVLFGSHLQELKDTTHSILYENYRSEKLTDQNKQGTNNGTDDGSLFNLNNYSNRTFETQTQQPKSKAETSTQDEEALKEILDKKRAIENYAKELQLLENKYRVSSISSFKHSKIVGSDVSTNNSYNF